MTKRAANQAEEEIEPLPLSKSAEFLLQECRMILPGIQAIFGFQLMAVFNSAFDQKLSHDSQRLFGIALFLMGVAMVLVMTPAAYHRQTGIHQITERFIYIASRMLLVSMLPLGISILIDVYLVAQVLFHDDWNIWLSTALAVVFFILWVVLPRSDSLKRLIWVASTKSPTAKPRRK